jgi:CheY-like chemotaxis protein
MFMDVQMPEMDGFDTTAAIRAREHGTERRLPIIAITAHAMKNDRERCLQAGMDGYIAKPVQAAELWRVIDALAPRAVLPAAPVCPPAAPACPPAEPKEEGLDRAEALRRVNGDEALLSEIATLFLADYPRLLTEIDSAIVEGDAKRLRLAAHTLKGSLSFFGARSASENARQLEMMGLGGIMTDAAAVFTTLQEQMSRLHPAIRDLGAQPNACDGGS